ncbi:shikimate dehydrogenase family protein [Desulfovibrio sp. SGI.169]|uniref:shikimate dehydrogenase family protein n=1 Tax=Desulfovibrio sp. SGI.169 TaxID=3420561 RepID=UPI003D024FD4
MPPSAPKLFLPADLYGVTGWPLAQTLSPLLHNTGFQTLGIPAVYLRWEVPPERLPAFVDSVRLLGVKGCSVTIPHKMALLPLLDRVSPQAGLAGAVNTIYWDGAALCGENTDVSGFLAPLAGMPLENMDALLLGAGGAAHAVAAGLRLRRCRKVFAATPSNRSHLPLAERFGFTPVPWEQRHDVPAGLIINATPLGMRGKHEGESPYDFSLSAPVRAAGVTGAASGDARVDTAPVAYDIVYNPLETRFLREARRAGRRCVTGLEMFFGQGDAQFRLWTGRPLPPEARRNLEKALYGAP